MLPPETHPAGQAPFSFHDQLNKINPICNLNRSLILCIQVYMDNFGRALFCPLYLSLNLQRWRWCSSAREQLLADVSRIKADSSWTNTQHIFVQLAYIDESSLYRVKPEPKYFLQESPKTVVKEQGSFLVEGQYFLKGKTNVIYNIGSALSQHIYFKEGNIEETPGLWDSVITHAQPSQPISGRCIP